MLQSSDGLFRCWIGWICLCTKGSDVPLYAPGNGRGSAPAVPIWWRPWTREDLSPYDAIWPRRRDAKGHRDARPFVECLRAGNPAGDACPDAVAVYRRKLAEIDSCMERLSRARTTPTRIR